MHEINPGEVLIFRWREGGTNIDVGRPENEEYIWDRNIRVYDDETGKVLISTYADFKARIVEWLEDQREADGE
ncbi:hypothetical protein [Streptomyces ardesiacus]|uniref:hypothetical protein n=1 Tax=Streptomyces ardesiacus TaxID=285564 RepID=UPI0036609910